MKHLQHSFIYHLRLYRTFNFLFFTFLLCVTSLCISFFSSKIYAQDLLEQAFKPAMSNETIINMGNTKNAVGNEVFREWVNVQTDLWVWCFVNNQKITNIETQKSTLWFTWSSRNFCEQVLGWDRNTSVLQTEAPLIVRITKFLLRITMVLAVTMVIYNGIMWIIESSRWWEVKDAQKNITLIITGLFIALMSLWIINLISSITISSLGTNSQWHTAWCLIQWNVLMGDTLKEYVCKNASFGHPSYTLPYRVRNPNRVGNRCWFADNWIFTSAWAIVVWKNPSPNNDWSRKAISDGEMISKCIELNWEWRN